MANDRIKKLIAETEAFKLQAEKVMEALRERRKLEVNKVLHKEKKDEQKKNGGGNNQQRL
jgi:hypothetical protein